MPTEGETSDLAEGPGGERHGLFLLDQTTRLVGRRPALGLALGKGVVDHALLVLRCNARLLDRKSVV